MADLTETQLKWLHAQVGSNVDDSDLQATYDRLGSTRDVAIEYLRERRIGWLNSPLTVSVSGVASLSLAENVKAIERQIAQLVKMDDDPSDDPGGGGVDASGPSDLETFGFQRSRRR